MAQNLKDLNLNLHEWQQNLLEELLEKSKSENLPPVFHHHRSSGKSWILRWLKENDSLISKSNGKSFVPLPRITKADTSTLALRNKPNISVVNEKKPIVIYYDEMSYPVNDELYEKLRQITDKMKKSVDSEPKNGYNIFFSSGIKK